MRAGNFLFPLLISFGVVFLLSLTSVNSSSCPCNNISILKLCDKERENIIYYEVCVCGNQCNVIKQDKIYCGDPSESDGGINIYKFGVITKYVCDGEIYDNQNICELAKNPSLYTSECVKKYYFDFCRGICSRNEINEYYLSGKDVYSEIFSNLFSNNEYCKNGEVFKDKLAPFGYFFPSSTYYFFSSGWVNNETIKISLTCNDYDESGCYYYSYTLEKLP